MLVEPLVRTAPPPPPPHDPRDRELVMQLGRWEVRVSTGRAFEYFVPRGRWHVQLWHPEAGISILTPSKLTAGAFEAYPSRGWKARSCDYGALRDWLEAEHDTPLPSDADMSWIERVLVDRIVASAGTSPAGERTS